MRHIATLLIHVTILIAVLILVALATPVMASADETDFSRVQTDCASVGNITLGENGRWEQCQVTKGRWVSTIGIIDFYQAQYCLGTGPRGCDKRALLLFANRAYTPTARLVLERIDPGDTQYDDPLVMQTPRGPVMALTARRPDAQPATSYHLWHEGRWQPTEAWTDPGM